MVGGKVVLVTGAASGIGAASARALHGQGAKLVLTDVNEAGLRELLDDLGEARALGIAGDVVDLGAMHAVVAEGVRRFGGIDMVLANAGVGGWGTVLATPPARFRRVLEVNLLGVFHTVRAALPTLLQRRGYVLVVASLASYVPAPGLAGYNASKAGVEHFAGALRLELAEQGVGVGTAHLSWVDTPLLRDELARSPGFARMLASLPGPLKHTLSADDCAARIVPALGRRRRRVDIPGWVALARWAKPLFSTRPVERQLLRHAAPVLAGRP